MRWTLAGEEVQTNQWQITDIFNSNIGHYALEIYFYNLFHFFFIIVLLYGITYTHSLVAERKNL